MSILDFWFPVPRDRLKSHHFILTGKKLKKLKNQQFFLHFSTPAINRE